MDENKDSGETEQKKVTFHEENDKTPHDPDTTKGGSEDEGNSKDASSDKFQKPNNNVDLLGRIGDVPSSLSQEGNNNKIEHNIRLGLNMDICENSNESNRQMDNNASVLIIDEKKIAHNNTVEYKSAEITVPEINNDNKDSYKYLHDFNIDQEVILNENNENNEELTSCQTREVEKKIQSFDIKNDQRKFDNVINLNDASHGTLVGNNDNTEEKIANQENAIISKLNSLNQDKTEDKCEVKTDKEAISVVEITEESKEIDENLSEVDIAHKGSPVATRNIEYQTDIEKDLYMSSIVSCEMLEENKDNKEKITANQEKEINLNLTNFDQKQVLKKPEESKDFESKKSDNGIGKDLPVSNIDGVKAPLEKKNSNDVSVTLIQHAFIETYHDNNEVTHYDISDVDKQVAPFKTQDNEIDGDINFNVPSIISIGTTEENSTNKDICKSVNKTQHNTEIETDQHLDTTKVDNNTKDETMENQNGNNIMIEKLTDSEQSNYTHYYLQSATNDESQKCKTSKVIQHVIDTNQQIVHHDENLMDANTDDTIMDNNSLKSLHDNIWNHEDSLKVETANKSDTLSESGKMFGNVDNKDRTFDQIDRSQCIGNIDFVDNRQDDTKLISPDQSYKQGNTPQLMHSKFVEQLLEDANADTNCDNKKISCKLGHENNTEKDTNLKSEKTTNLQSKESKSQDYKSISINNESNGIVRQIAIAEAEINVKCNMSSQNQNSGKRVEQYAKAQSARYLSRRTSTTHADTASYKSSAGKPKSRSTRRSTRPSTGFLTDESRRKEREFFHAELQRLKDSLRKESKKIKKPKLRDHYPDVFTSLEPYYNTYTASYLINMPELGYKETQPPEATKYMEEQKKKNLNGKSKDLLFTTRRTAIGLCDPWDSLDMDRSVLPKLETAEIRRKRMEQIHASEMNTQKSAKSDSNEDGGDQSPRQKRPEAKQGSTRLPKFPVIAPPDSELTTKELYYGDVPMLREELVKSFSHYGENRKKSDYNRTREDFFRMELDKLDDYHKSSRPHMTAAYFAYLQNTPGSRMAIYDCMKEVRNSKKKEESSLQAIA